MQLLSPQQIQTKANSEEALRISRIKSLREVEESLRISTAKAEADFQRMLADKRKEWEVEWETHQKEVKEMGLETERLTRERSDAMIPVGFLKQEAEKVLEEKKVELEKVKEQELENERTKILLEERLSEVGEREDKLKENEKKNIFRGQHLDKRSKTVQEAETNLALAIKSFNEDSDRKRKELQAKETELILKESSLTSRERGLEGKEQDLENREKRLKDERGTLDRAWTEVNRKRFVS